MSTSEKSYCSSAFTFRVLLPNETSTPMLRRDASATTSSAGERALVEDVEHFAAHITGGADDRDLETHGKTPERQAAAKAAGAACF